MIVINDTIKIDESLIKMEFILSSGPGGQNINKVATAVRLRFDLTSCDAIPEEWKERILRQNKKNINKDGFLVISVKRHRSQERNRKEAMDKLAEIIALAKKPRKKRLRTSIPPTSKLKRLTLKKRRGDIAAILKRNDASPDRWMTD